MDDLRQAIAVLEEKEAKENKQKQENKKQENKNKIEKERSDDESQNGLSEEEKKPEKKLKRKKRIKTTRRKTTKGNILDIQRKRKGKRIEAPTRPQVQVPVIQRTTERQKTSPQERTRML